MSTDESDSDREYHTHSDTLTLAGYGEVDYQARHDHERTLQSVVSRLETAVEMVNAHYFNQSPRDSLGTKRANTEYKLRPIQRALEQIHERPTYEKHIDGELDYVVAEGYYPDDYEHLIDLTDLPIDQRSRAFSHAQNVLCQHGYAVNSVRCDDAGRLERLHIVSMAWVYDARSHGKRKAKEEIDA